MQVGASVAAGAVSPSRQRRWAAFEEHELGLPQTVVFDLFQRHRRTILQRLRSHPDEAGQAMEAVARVVTFTGTRLRGYKHLHARQWAEMDAGRNAGRFAVVERSPSPPRMMPAAATAAAPTAAALQEGSRDASPAAIGGGSELAQVSGSGASSRAGSPSVAEAPSYNDWLAHEELARSAQQEVNVQLGEYCASSSSHKQMRVLPPEMVSGFEDFEVVFGSGADASSFQSAEVQSTSARTWLRLVGQRHDLQRWAPDDRVVPPTLSTPYRGMLPTLIASLPWVSELLEPVREAHFGALSLLAPSPDVHLFRDHSSIRVVLLEATSGGEGRGVEKEVIVLRDPPLVQVFNVVEHGRRWYRSLVFASDASCCLADLPSTVAHHAGVPALVCGDALTQTPPAPSLVISRSSSNQRRVDDMSLDGGEQTFLPTRLLRGLLPAALLELYVFWQNEHDDSIEGFPSPTQLQQPAVQPTVLHIDLSRGACVLSDSGLSGPNASASVRRFRAEHLETPSWAHAEGATPPPASAPPPGPPPTIWRRNATRPP